MTGGELNKLRRDGFIPASISSRGHETQQCTVSRQKLETILRAYGSSALIELQAQGASRNVLAIARARQTDPISGKLIHVGFQALSAREAVTVDVRLILQGEPEAVRHGTGTLEQTESAVKVRAMPDKLPAHVTVDTSEMQLGDVLHMSAVAISPDYEFVTTPDTVIAVLHGTKRSVAEREEELAEGAAADETAAVAESD
jgi:large subunit ribosomal protein L25